MVERIENEINRKLIESEKNEIITYLNNPLFYSNSPQTKNKFKNDSLIDLKELIGIVCKDAYSQESKKIENNIFINNNKIQDMFNIEDILVIAYSECLKHGFNMNFNECIDYDIEPNNINTEIFCKKCKSVNILPVEEHHRAADEASENYLKCEDCGNRFYF